MVESKKPVADVLSQVGRLKRPAEDGIVANDDWTAVTDLSEATRSQAQTIDKTAALRKLPPAAQGLALAGFTRGAEIINLPANLKLVAIAMPFGMTAQITTILEFSDCVRALVTNIQPKPQDGFSTRYYLVPGSAEPLMDLAKAKNLPISIAVAQNTEAHPTRMMKIGSAVIPLHPTLVDFAQINALLAEENSSPILIDLSDDEGEISRSPTERPPSGKQDSADDMDRITPAIPTPVISVNPVPVISPEYAPATLRSPLGSSETKPVSVIPPSRTQSTTIIPPPSPVTIIKVLPEAAVSPSEGVEKVIESKPEFTGDAISTEALLYAAATIKPDNVETQETAEIPREGPCSYLDVDFNKLLQPGADPKLIQRLFLTLQELPATHFLIVLNENGGLRIITLAEPEAEKTGQAILFLAAELRKVTQNSVVCYAAAADIKHSESTNSYWLDGAIENEYFAEVRKLGPGIFSSTDDYGDLLKARDNTVLTCVSQPSVDNPKYLELTPKKPPVRFRGGLEGPRELIGAENIMFALKEIISPSSSVRLGILTGNRGQGKSRMLEELLGQHPDALCFVASPERRNRDGGGLITLLEEMDLNLRKKLKGYDALSDGLDPRGKGVQPEAQQILRRLDQFSVLPEIDKRKMVTESPDSVVELFIAAVDLFENINNCGAIVAVDDCHHLDAFTDPHFCKAIEKLLKRNNKTKVLLAYRPEQRYVSNHQKELEARMQSELSKQNSRWGVAEYVRRVSLVDENERPYFDLANSANAQAFVRGTLDLEYEDWNFGTWPEEIGAKCPSPLHFATFLSAATQKNSDYLIYDPANKTVDIARPKAIDLINKISNNLGSHYLDVISDLPEGARNVLYCLSLVTGNLSAEQILQVVNDTFRDPSKADIGMEVFAALADKGLVSSQKDQQGHITGFRLFHEAIGESILEDMIDGAERTALANCIYEKFGSSDQIPAKAMITVLKYADFPLSEEEGWGHFAANAYTVLEGTNESRDYQAGYELGALMMYGLGEKYYTEEEKKYIRLHHKAETNFAKAVELLRKGQAKAAPGIKPLGEDVQSCILLALTAVVKNGVYVGRFTEAFQAIDILAEIHGHGAEVPEIESVYRLGMRAAQIQKNGKIMRIYKELLAAKTGDKMTVEKISDELRAPYGQGDFDGAMSIFQSYEKPIQAELKAGKLTKSEITTFEFLGIHIGMEKILHNVEKKGVDQDFRMDPIYLDDETKESLISILRKVKEIQSDREKLDPFHEMSLMEREGQIYALLGCYTRAMHVWSKLWAKSMSMGIYPYAHRAAYLRSVITAQQAYETVEEPDNIPENASEVGKTELIPGSPRVGYLHYAYNINRTESKEASDKLEYKDQHRFFTSLHVLRYVGAYLMGHRARLDEAKDSSNLRAELKLQFGAKIATALADYREMNLPKYGDLYKTATDGETTYDGNLVLDSAYIGEILEWANVLDLKDNIKADEELPFITKELITSAHRHLESIEDLMDFDILGEKDRKREALAKLDYYAGKIHVMRLRPREVS